MKLLYLGGKKWKSDTMINSVLVRPNTKELLESKGVQVYALDSSTDIGLQVSGLGGILSLLRFAVDV